jgi:hypothetical protein
VRRLIADGELTGYRIGKSGRLIRVDRNEIDQNLMRLMGGRVWRDTTPNTPADVETSTADISVPKGPVLYLGRARDTYRLIPKDEWPFRAPLSAVCYPEEWVDHP